MPDPSNHKKLGRKAAALLLFMGFTVGYASGLLVVSIAGHHLGTALALTPALLGLIIWWLGFYYVILRPTRLQEE